MIAHNIFNAIFVYWTFVGSVFTLFLSALGLPKDQIGVMLSLFPFCGLVALGFAPLAARLGYKRVLITGYTARILVLSSLLLLPWLLFHTGRTVTIAVLFGVFAIFALLRALAETAYYPWTLEFVSPTVRGKFAAVNTGVSTVVAALALLVASRVIGAGGDLSRFLLLIAVGSGCGLIGVSMLSQLPGGIPVIDPPTGGAHHQQMAAALRDRTFTRCLIGMGCVTLGGVLLTSFLPLYVKEQLEVSPGAVVALDTATMVGGVASSIFWGWLADRAGSRRVLLPGIGIGILITLGWLLLPRHLPQMLLWCGLLNFWYGVSISGIGIGTDRLLFAGVIPTEKSGAYTAIYYAWIGLIGGIAPLLAGALLTACANRHETIGGYPLDGHAMLFALSLLLLAVGLGWYRLVRPGVTVTGS